MALVALFSLARGVCSVAEKDVLGKAISKRRRGSSSGYATAVAGIAAVAAGWHLQGVEGDRAVLALLLLLAAALWALGGMLFTALRELPGATEGGGDALREALSHL